MRHAEYDDEADVLYVELARTPVEQSRPIDDLRVVDYASDGSVAGIEFIGAKGGVDLRSVPHAKQVEALVRDLGFRVFV